MISVVASIWMACLVTPWFPGFEVNWNLKHSSTAPPSSFSNVVKRIKDTHSESTKASNNTKQCIQQGN